MKRHIVTVSLLSTILGAGAINSQAAPPPNHPENIAQAPKGDVPHSDRMGPSASADFQRETNFLHLNADQQKKISGILAEQREKVSPLIKKLDHLRLQLHEAELATNLDEPGLRSLAKRLSKIETELIISHAKMNRRVMAVLTKDQRELLKKKHHQIDSSHRPSGRPESTTGSDRGHGR
ncbi:MAG: Spy/CpxP family protein refolding chaperone [Geobacteraceae bacterium]